jgi:hypothetical protein
MQVPNTARIQGLALNRRGTLLLANCHDRTIRMYEVASHASALQLAAGLQTPSQQLDGQQDEPKPDGEQPQQPPKQQQLLTLEAMKQRLAGMDIKVGL